MSFHVEDVIAECDDGKPHDRLLDVIDTVALHRIGASLGHDAPTICARFIKDPEVVKYTGGEVPYTFFVFSDGCIQQALPLSDVGRHARVWNTQATGIAFHGDFREHPPTALQREAGLWLCSVLARGLSLGAAAFRAHDELPGGSGNPNKRCPGDLFEIKEFRATLSDELLLEGISYLHRQLVI